jgi:hypothetical protein
LLPASWQFGICGLRADLSNFFFLQHRRIDGFIVTGKNSGSHWLKFMISAGLAQKYGLELPAYSSGRLADELVGNPTRPRRHAGIPRIGTSHTIPSVLLRAIPRIAARRPPIVVMVRNIEDALQSNYRKWRGQYNAPPSAFTRGDPWGRRFVADAWWYVHFFNRWGAWAAADPDRVLLVRYEDLQAAPDLWLPRIAGHLQLGFDAAALRAALAFTSKEAIQQRQDPNAGEVIVPDPVATPAFAFDDADLLAIRCILRRHLRHDFGYGLPTVASAVHATPTL